MEKVTGSYPVRTTQYINSAHVRGFMKLEHLFEGKMKRSDPVISGERQHAVNPVAKKSSSFQTRIAKIAASCNATEAQVLSKWREISSQVDSSLPNKWAIVQARVSRHFS